MPSVEVSACRRQRTPPAVVFRANCAFQAPRCSAGHELRITICPVGAQVCDSCKRHVMSTYTHRCRACDYDLCRRCFVSRDSSFEITDTAPSLLPSLEHQDLGVDDGEPACFSRASSDKPGVETVDSVPAGASAEQLPPESNSKLACLRPPPKAQPKTLHQLDRKNQRLQLVYGNAAKHPCIARPSGGAKKVPPCYVGPPSRQSSDACHFDDLMPTCEVSCAAHLGITCNYHLAVDPVITTVTGGVALPPSEKWRVNCATVAIAEGSSDRAKSPRPIPRSAALRARYGRQRRAGEVQAGILRPSVDELQGCFGRARWAFD